MHACTWRETFKARLLRRAFSSISLAELVMVLLVMAIVAGIVVPRYVQANARYHVEGAMRRMRRDLDLARNACREDGRARVVTFKASPPSMTVTCAGGGKTAGVATYTVDYSVEPYRATMMLAASAATATLNINGSGEYLNSVSVMLAEGPHRAGLVCGVAANSSGGQQVLFGYSTLARPVAEEFAAITTAGTSGKVSLPGGESMQIIVGAGGS